jgi:DMSO/TMAO reductase YedYZ molybdopterin-dependent catalytic subunit
MVTRGFTGRQSGSELSDRIPPGQHLVDNFPVLTAGPTPRIDPADWTFTLKVGPRPVKAWSWSEFNALPRTRMTRDIHCVTSWSKLNTAWEGVAVDDILTDAGFSAPSRCRATTGGQRARVERLRRHRGGRRAHFGIGSRSDQDRTLRRLRDDPSRFARG